MTPDFFFFFIMRKNISVKYESVPAKWSKQIVSGPDWSSLHNQIYMIGSSHEEGLFLMRLHHLVICFFHSYLLPNIDSTFCNSRKYWGMGRLPSDTQFLPFFSLWPISSSPSYWPCKSLASPPAASTHNNQTFHQLFMPKPCTTKRPSVARRTYRDFSQPLSPKSLRCPHPHPPPLYFYQPPPLSAGLSPNEMLPCLQICRCKD